MLDTSNRPFGLPDLVTTVVDLPFPPSTNAIWRGTGRRIHIAPKYRQWQKDADTLAIANLVGRNSSIASQFEAHIGLNNDIGHRGDVDNYGKAVLDWAQSRELISNDKHCRRLTIEWVERANAPAGCRLTLRELCA